MGLPSKKRTPRSKHDRASHFALKPKTVSIDKDGNAHLPHKASPKTGAYNGRSAKSTAKRAERTLRKTAKAHKHA